MMVAGRGSGQNWALTADTINDPNVLTAEHIIDGRVVKIGSGDAAKVASAITADLANWDPSTQTNPNSFEINQSSCNPWKIRTPTESGGFASFEWAPQVTAAMPFEAISDLFAKNAAKQPHALLSTTRGATWKQMISVTKDFFQSSPNGISATAVKDDAARVIDDDTSPKTLTTIMPRTDFTTIFAQVKGSVPGSLYTIVKVLACYKNDGNNIVLDTDYCTGTIQAPVPGIKMDGQAFTVTNSLDPEPQSLKVSDWINGIGGGTVPDGLTTLDKAVDSSIGGLGTALENLVGTTNRAIPLFEFRNLAPANSPDFETRVTQFAQAVIDYHNAHLNVPRDIVKKADAKYFHIKRAAPSITACSTTIPSSSAISSPITTPPPSCTLHKSDPDSGVSKPFCVCNSSTFSVLSVATTATGPDASCTYTALPGSTAVITPTKSLGPAQTNSKLCQVCTPVEINEDSCTTIPNCYPQAAVASVQAGTSLVNVGTLTGTALYTSISSALEKLCLPVTKSGSSITCSTDTVSIGSIASIELGELSYGELDVTVESSQYNATSLRDAMIKSAALTAQNSATGKNCQNVTYEKLEVKKRSTLDWFQESVGLKTARDNPFTEIETISICNAGGFAGVQYFSRFWRTAPNADATDFLDVSWKFKDNDGEFFCDFLEELADGLAVIEPEFAVEDVKLGEDIKAICTQAVSAAA